MADDTAALLDQLGIGNADVMGFSNGGLVALQLAIRHSGHVRSLVICSAAYQASGLPRQLWESFDTATLDSMPPVLRQALLDATPDKAQVPAMFARMIERRRDTQAVITDPAGQYAREGPGNRLHEIQRSATAVDGGPPARHRFRERNQQHDITDHRRIEQVEAQPAV